MYSYFLDSTEEITQRYNQTVLRKKVNQFNSEYKIIASTEYNSTGEVTSKCTLENGANSHKVRTCYSLLKQRLTKVTEYFLDRQGNITEGHHFADGVIRIVELFFYDSRRNLIEKIEADNTTNEKIITRFKYDKSGNKIETAISKGNIMTDKVLYVYDPKGNLAEKLKYGVSGNLIMREIHKYEYDSEGNWITHMVVVNGSPKPVIVHYIKYY